MNRVGPAFNDPASPPYIPFRVDGCHAGQGQQSEIDDLSRKIASQFHGHRGGKHEDFPQKDTREHSAVHGVTNSIPCPPCGNRDKASLD